MVSPDFDVLVLGDCKPDLVASRERIEPAAGQFERLVDGAERTIGGLGGAVGETTAQPTLEEALAA